MEKSENRKITSRLIFSFSLLILIFILFGLYSLYEIRIISGLTRTIYNHPLVVSNAALQSDASIIKMHRNMKDVVLFESEPIIQQSVIEVNQEEQLVYYSLDIIRENILGVEGKNLENETRKLFDQWRPIREEVIALVHDGKRNEAAEITIGKGADHVAKLEEKMIALTSYARTKATLFMNEEEKTHLKLNVSIIIFFILVITISSIIAIFTLTGTSSAEKEIIRLNRELEQRVEERTKDLIRINKELQGEISERKQTEKELYQYLQDLKQFERLSVRREERMIELKEEINGLLQEMGQVKKYKIV